MGKALVGVVIGSRADFNIMKRALEALRVMGIPYLLEFASSHKTPERVIRFAHHAMDEGIEVLICAAGGAAHIAGVLASHTTLPIIAVPIDSTSLRGEDALHSMVQMPPGMPVAVVAINGAENAAMLAAQILALKHAQFRPVLHHQRAILAQRVESSFNELLAQYPDLIDPARTAAPYSVSLESDDTDPGSEGETPDPNRRSGDRISPGAVSGSAPQSVRQANRLVRTPVPQEPSAVTEDKEIEEELRNGGGMRAPTPVFPPPPLDSDLAGSGWELLPTAERQPRGLAEASGAASPLEVLAGVIETQIFQIDHANPDEDILSHAMVVLLEGGVIAFPTDTVYGLAADATNAVAVRRLYEIKGQAMQRKSLSVLIHNPVMLDVLVKEVPGAIEPALDHFWPGGMTVIFSKSPNVLSDINDSATIAVRVPDDPIPLRLMEMMQRPLAVINASYRESPAAVNAREVQDRFNGRIECVLDAGACRSGQPSTVVSVIGEPFEILREGVVPVRDLKKMLGTRLKD